MVRVSADEDGSGNDAFELREPPVWVRPVQVPAPRVPAAAHVSSTAPDAAAAATATTPTAATTAGTSGAATTTTTVRDRGPKWQAGDGAGDGTPAHGRCTGARCTLVLCVPGDLHVASGCASRCRPHVLRVLRVPHVFVLLPLGLPLEVGWMCHAFFVFCSTTSKRSPRRSQPRQWIHRRSRR